VRRLAGDAGGTPGIDSTPGAGTTVTITFPAAENDA
jgi:signal transduction histidine kinase